MKRRLHWNLSCLPKPLPIMPNWPWWPYPRILWMERARFRIAVQWNDEPIKILDFKTEGRSKTWKENVFTNKAIKKMQVAVKTQGKQKIKIFMVDQGVLLDYIVLKTSKVTLPYQLGAETRIGEK